MAVIDFRSYLLGGSRSTVAKPAPLPIQLPLGGLPLPAPLAPCHPRHGGEELGDGALPPLGRHPPLHLPSWSSAATSSHHLNRRTSTGGSAPAERPAPALRPRPRPRRVLPASAAAAERKTRARGEARHKQRRRRHWFEAHCGRATGATQCSTGWRTARRRPPSRAAGGRAGERARRGLLTRFPVARFPASKRRWRRDEREECDWGGATVTEARCPAGLQEVFAVILPLLGRGGVTRSIIAWGTGTPVRRTCRRLPGRRVLGKRRCFRGCVHLPCLVARCKVSEKIFFYI